MKMYKEIKRMFGLINLIVVSLFVGCSSPTEPISPILFELDARLFEDDNGYYHLPLDDKKWQTTHRISGHVYRDGMPVNIIKFGWSGSHYWVIGDTLGYIVESALTDDLEYVSYNTSYVTWFEGFEVPIVNGASYSREDGEVNTMIAPVRSMKGDTATIYYGYHDNWTYDDTYGEFYVIFD